MNAMKPRPSAFPKAFLEVLEARIAPAGLVDANFKAVPAGTSVLLTAGQGLATSDTGGSYLLYVEKGSAVVFTTDLNANNKVDFNEITGIAAGNGLRLVSFVDINGDIVTNLGNDGKLTDSDGNAANGRDGKIVLNNRIESIVLRSVTSTDLDPLVAGNTVQNRLAKSSYSIFGNIFAGGGLGISNGDPALATVGLQIDTSGFAAQATKFAAVQTLSGEGTPIPSVGFIFTGSATSGQYFSFGTSPEYGDGPAQSLRGSLAPFLPAAGQLGGDVYGVNAANSASFHLGGVVTGKGGFGARGGNISEIDINGDIGGLLLQTGSGGVGETGGNGGSISGLSIVNSINSAVKIVTGDGGAGLIGRAGQAGTVTFNGSIELFAQVTVGLGKGGDALGNAGAGTSISSGTFTNINPGTYLPAGILTTWRSPGDIGDQRLINPNDVSQGYITNQFDMDGDGFNDSVVLTDNPDQIFVAFGTAAGGFDASRSYFLPSLAYANAELRTSAVVVLDANGDGLPDIVTGQSTGDGFSGVLTYINRGASSLDNSWQGFATPRYSPLPAWTHFSNVLAGDTVTDAPRNTPQAIINLVAGDFDRDGIMDLGVVAMGRTPAEPGAVTVVFPYYATLSVMKGLAGSDGIADGFFAVDYAKGTTSQPSQLPAFYFGRGNLPDFSYVVKATASEAGDPGTDLITIISKGGLGTSSPTAPLFRGERFGVFSIDATSGDLEGAFSQLRYTDRTIGGNPVVWTGYGSAVFNIRAADFVVADVDLDGAFDAIVVGQPTGNNAPDFLVAATLKGLEDGTISQLAQVDNTFFPGESYFGIALTEKRPSAGPVASVLSATWTDVPILRMVSGDFDGDPTTADFALNGINLITNPDDPQSQIGRFSVTGFGQYDGEFVKLGVAGVPEPGYSAFGETDSAFLTSFFDFYSDSANLAAGVFNALAPVGVYYAVSPSAAGFVGLASSTISLSAGGGGWSLLGAGGVGGSIGGGVFGGAVNPISGATTPTAITAVGYTSYNFVGGQGGFGLLSGGRAGNVSGVEAVVYFNRLSPVEVAFTTLDGGSSLLGAGGAGGTISQFMARVQFSPDRERPDAIPVITLTAGNGGSGTSGGAGGSVLGRANAAIPDTQTEPSQTVNFDDLFIFAGDGGFGMAAGGRGGAITGVISEFGGGDVEISAGWGGNSAAGAAGAGGDVSLQPSPNLNKLRGDLALTAGGGGDGLTGGAGGSIRNFINSPTTSFNPSSLSAFAGDGGSGVTGNGGAGGSISGFNVATANTAGGIALVMAGRGGFSSAGVGGVGGGFSSLTVTSEAGAVVAVAGAGGDGLRGGGTGGSLSSSRINSGGLDNARVVVVAGKGGDAHGVTAATIAAENSLPAYSSLYRSALFTLGTANGLGGTGGSISNFTQPQALQTSVDIIAGNGGDTINYGKILGASGVGRGGSITNVNLANDAGKIAPNTAIRAYAEDFAEQLRDGSITEITDDTGNVGVVVGAAGRVRNDLPSSTGVAGSVSGFRAQNIMSMVAGSVDRIAAITSISGLQLQNGGTQIGVAKNGYLDPNLNDGTVYTFNPANPVARPFATTYYAAPNGSGAYLFAPGAVQGGALVDGAILTKSYSGPASSRVFVVN